ncbi:hypothetical protein [Enterobacter kobei]|uniref:hypothetical protein n=1 Tax=Enterobacter kobei TaxID=208224 RepID=UPI001FD42C2B|nr:hypothetical protein [Enterobacter kobei]MCK7036055.1 hypothetical protein [Enterobacter kobei]MCM7044696.1 hypothetical protein [Enterobacter kobei]
MSCIPPGLPFGCKLQCASGEEHHDSAIVRAANQAEFTASLDFSHNIPSRFLLSSTTTLKPSARITGDAEQDAYQTILNGANQSARLNAQASADRISGRNASTSGYISAGSSLLSAGGTAYNGWKKAGSK